MNESGEKWLLELSGFYPAAKNVNVYNIISAVHCKSACTVQENFNQMSYAAYPQWGRFFYQSAFCNTASHIWFATCQNENRKYFLEKRHPNLCKTLELFDEYWKSPCSHWPKNYFQTNEVRLFNRQGIMMRNLFNSLGLYYFMFSVNDQLSLLL